MAQHVGEDRRRLAPVDAADQRDAGAARNVALVRHRVVDRDGQHVDAGIARPVHHVRGEIEFRRRVELAPDMLGRDAGDVLDRPRRHARQHERDVAVARDRRQMRLGVRPEDAHAADRGHAERQVVAAAEERPADIGRHDPRQAARHHLVALEAGDVARHAAAIAVAALGIVEQERRQPPVSLAPEVVDGERVGKPAHARSLLALTGGRPARSGPPSCAG